MKRVASLVALAMCSACGSASSADTAQPSPDASTSHGGDTEAFVDRSTSTGLASSTTTTTTTSTTAATTTTTTTTSPIAPTSTSTSTVPTNSTSTSTSTSTTVTTPTSPSPLDPTFASTNAAFEALAGANAAVSLTVDRDGTSVVARASGTTIAGSPATSDSPMVVASVSKIIVAFAITRLAQRGDVIVSEPMPWATIGVTPHEGWDGVTVRELLDHTSGMPVVRTSWFDGSGDCASFLPTLVAAPPRAHRGAWTYSNGNYCALGRLIEAVSGAPLDVAVQSILFDPLGVDGVHLTGGGLLPDDVAHSQNVSRYSRLGGAGTFVVSTDDLAALLASTELIDFETLANPGVLIDQYGWGHTGTVSGAKSCVWVMDSGRTSIAATVAGNSPDTGGAVCDRIVEAVARDLGHPGGRPDRSPP